MHSNALFMFATLAAITLVVGKNGVRNRAVADNLDRAVIVVELLLCDYIRVVAVYDAIDTDDTLDSAGYCSHIVRDHNDCHLLVKLLQ